MFEKIIYHIDVNSAFLSWEATYRLYHKGGKVDLREQVAAVGGDVTMRHGIILAKSIPAKKFIAETQSDEDIMLQGVIDCVVITDDGIAIIDYKTDRNFDETDTVEKYRIQLECYKYAAEKIFKKPVVSKILFMLDSGVAMTL